MAEGYVETIERFYNNIIVNHNGLIAYDDESHPTGMAGNVFLKGAKPSKHETDPIVSPDFDPAIKLLHKPEGVFLEITLDKSWADERQRQLVTTELLGKAKIPDMPYENPDGTKYRLETDYFGKLRNIDNPFPGPFEQPAGKLHELKVWPR